MHDWRAAAWRWPDRERELQLLNDDDQSRAEARGTRAIRLAIVAFCSVLLLAIVASVQLSTLDVTFGTLVFGSDVIWRGQNASFRVAAYDPRGIELVGPIAAHLTLKDETGARVEGEGEGSQFIEAGFEVPEDLGTEPILDLEIETPDGPDSISIPLQPSDLPPPLDGRISPAAAVFKPGAARPKGTFAIALYPQGCQIISGLENVMYGVLTRNGAPLVARIRSADFDVDTESANNGTFRFVYTPTPSPRNLALDLELSGGTTETVQLPVITSQAGLLVEAEPSRFLRAGGEVRLRVRTLPFRDPIHLDIWAGGALLVASSGYAAGGSREVVFFVPKETHGFVRADAYRNLAADPDGVSTLLMWASSAQPQQAALEALEALDALAGGDPIQDAARAAASEDARVLLTEMALSRFEPTERGAPLLRSTLAQRRIRVASRTDALRGGVNTLFVLTVVLGLALVLGWSVRHQLHVKRAMRGVVDEGIAAGELDREGTERLARVSHLYDLAMAIVAVLLAVYGIYLLLVHVRWE